MKKKDFVLGAFIGSLVGAVTALLMAPKSGREVRADLAFQVENITEKTKELASNVSEKTHQLASDVTVKSKQFASEVVDKTSGIASTVADKTQGIVSTVADKTQGIVSTVTDRTQEVAKTVSNQTSQWAGKANSLAGAVVEEVKSWREIRPEAEATELNEAANKAKTAEPVKTE